MPPDLADLSEEKMQDSMQLYKAYYADMHACPPESPPAGKEDFVDAAEKLCYTLIRYENPVLRFAGVAQSVEQLIRNQQVRCSSHPTSSIIKPCWRLPTGFLIYIKY